MLDRMAMVGLQSRLRPYRFDRFGEAWGVIREGRGDSEAEVFDVLQKFLGVLPVLRHRFMGDQDAVMLVLDDHHTVVRPQRVGAVNMTLRGWGERKPLPQHLLGGGQMRANG